MKTSSLIYGVVAAALLLPLTSLAAGPAISVEDAETMEVQSLEAALAFLESYKPTAESDPRSTLALGIVQHRSGNFDNANKTFNSLYGTSEEHHAKFYQARMAEVRGDYDQARTLYEGASNQYMDLVVQERADNALFALPSDDWSSVSRQQISNRNFAYISAKAKGVDGLIDPDDTIAVDTSDAAFDVLLAGSMTVWAPDANTNVRIGANLFREDYVDFSDYNLQMLGLSTQLHRTFGRNLLKVQLGASDLSLGGEDYLGYKDFGLTNTMALNDRWDFQVSGLYRDISSDNTDFDYYEGNMLRAALELRGRDSNPWRFDYTYRNDEAADRFLQFTNDDGDVFDGFLSYSRDYHRIRGRYDLNWNERLSQTFTASMRSTEYDDPNLYLESMADTALTETIRDGFRYLIGTEISWTVNDRIRLLGEVEYFDENSNINEYDFDSLQFGIGFDYMF